MKHTVFVILALVIALSGCAAWPREGDLDYSTYTNQELIDLISEPGSPAFVYVTKELESRGPEAAEAAQALAIALQFPNKDSFLAGVALVAIGPDGKDAIPMLLEALDHDRGDVRQTALLALPAMDHHAKCAVPRIAELLWDPDGSVRYTAAAALEYIAKVDLGLGGLGFDPQHPNIGGFDDRPEGDLSGEARDWWLNEGIKQNWEEQSPYCD